MSVPRNAFKRSLKKLYDFIDLNYGAGALPLDTPAGGDANKLLAVNGAEDGYELVNDLVLDSVSIGGVNVNADPYLDSSADGALNVAGVNRLSKTSAGAYTLALPAVGDNGKSCIISSTSAFAHVVTVASAALHDGTGTPKDTLTFDAQPGASIHLVAINQTWHLIAKNVVTLTAA